MGKIYHHGLGLISACNKLLLKVLEKNSLSLRLNSLTNVVIAKVNDTGKCRNGN